MLAPKAVFDVIRGQGIEFFAGVPDSLLKDFCAYVTDHVPGEMHIIAANEGNAIALAMGHYLGSGKPGLVYMQNSGCGNAVNPITSLADREVYGIPMLVMVGWRGMPGTTDEPQHVKQGRIMGEFLRSLELPTFVLSATQAETDAMIVEACRVAVEHTTPVVVLVPPDAFDTYRLQKDARSDFEMNREAAVKCVVDAMRPGTIVIATTGKTSRELYEYRKARGDTQGNDFLTVGGMGHTASIALGLARAQKSRNVLCLDGDGSVLMHMGGLAIIGQSGQENLLHVVINNGAHDSVGGQPTVGFAIDLAGVATACGYHEAVTVAESDAVSEAITRLQRRAGPSLLEIRVNKGARSDLGRPKSSPAENRQALMRNLGA